MDNGVTMKHVSLLCGGILLALFVISAPGSVQASCPDPYCDSVSFDQCLLICPAGDLTFTVTVKDSCGDPVCDPNLWLDFTNCFATPCSTQTDWPIVYPVSCDAATGEHIFKIKAYAVDCANCLPDLYVNGQFCQPVRARFLSTNGDECVTQDDWFPALPCNDYNCDGVLTADDQQIFTDHIDHCCGPPTDTCLVDTLTINTGWDHTSGSLYPPGTWDPNWTVTCDPDPLTGEPRPANVIATYGAWQPALSNSSWISAYTDPTNDVNGLYCYELCFCLEQGFTNAELFVELRADDSAVVYLNGTPIVSTPAGSFGTATPTTHLETDQSLFQAGQNCIRVEAYNLQAVAAGLNLAGHVTADGLGVEELACCDSTGSLTGFKWFDYNADCVRQSNEPKLGGWTINVSPGGYSTTTDSLGNYYFTGIPAGTYTVTEVPQTPYAQVCPPGGSYNVTLGAGQVIAGLDFGNAYDCDLANPGPSCDSTIYDPCMVVCPNGDIPWVVTLVDSCGNPVCDDSTYVELNACQATPCPNSHPDWPRIFPDSCDPTTGEHFFHPKSGNPDCIDCFGVLYVGGGACGEVVVKHLDNNGDFCVGSDDWFAASCNDYNCDGSVDSTDLALHQAHTTHCCDNTGCPPGDAFCDSVTTDPCVVICPKGDITHVVTVKDSCGNPVCDLSGGVYMDFSNCPSVPCQDPTSSWPQVLPDSCDPATGEHFFNPAAGSQDCVDCSGTLIVNGSVCRDLIPKFLDVTGDLCVYPDDWLGNQLLCNDYNCDGTVNADDQAIHTAHLDHCCDNGGCQPGAPFCDSVTTDPCIVICPKGDITHVVTVKDSCGNPVCDLSGGVYLDFSDCPTVPCQDPTSSWPQVLPDSCNPATGEHFFNPAAGSQDCIGCEATLYVNGDPCRNLDAKFLDVTGDLCVYPDDWLGNQLLCNDYNCDGTVNADDQAIHTAHLDHCCDNGGCQPGAPFCDSVTTDPCMVICPQGDITHVVTVTDSCGNPVCDPNMWIDFSDCPTNSCPDSTGVDNWPIVYPDSCDPATGQHFFNPAAGSQDCIGCEATLYVNGDPCRNLDARFLDIDGDLCVTDTDFLSSGALCNDYNCDGVVDATDQTIHAAHLGHCCGSSNEINGYKWHDLDCDGEWDTGEPPLAGWSISLYQGTTFIASTTTNAAGEYSFTGLAPGAYRVTETVTSGWVQTYPPTVYHDVTVSGVITGVNFGNVEDDCQYNLTSSAQVAGTMDNFSGPEPSSPGADLLPAMTCPLGATHFFDSALTNQCWGHTFSDFFDTTCCVQGGQLCLRVAATGAIPDTDALAFFEDGQAVWGISMNDLVALATGGTDSVWSTGDTITVCLDLENLPPSALGVTNVLATLHDGDFDIRIQDDTEVDWMELRVEHCCPSCCVIRGDINNDGSGPDITDLTFFVNYLFGGGSAPPCLEQADANGDGSGPDITDLTFLVSYLFGGGTAPPPCP
ncbi:hypothetical protein GF356_11605 [candidate division GN15 bacterium]|nr:hypothetical protein [candidate division GN15 bacterium]